MPGARLALGLYRLCHKIWLADVLQLGRKTLTHTAEQRLAHLWRTQSGQMRSYFRKKLGENEAEDATALVFVRLAQAYEAGRDPNVGLVVNEVVYDTAREMSRRPITVAPERWAGEHILHRIIPDTQERYDFREAFDSALRALPGGEREAFILTELRGLSSREAEGVLGTSYRTIHRRAENARLTVREEIR